MHILKVNKLKNVVKLIGVLGNSVSRPCLIGFAPADMLHRVSFADVLNEESGIGYQRRLNAQHSLDFRRYVQEGDASTIPLTFNARFEKSKSWSVRGTGNDAVLEVDISKERVLAQVDCQHRLGHLHDLKISLPFLCFIGLSVREETEVFRIINGKARGLSTSLLDFHDSQLSHDLANERPELFVSLQLNNHDASPWRKQLDLGGDNTSGLMRRASLRMMQHAIKDHLIVPTGILKKLDIEDVALMVLHFWQAVTEVFSQEWNNPRKNMVTKGIGIYALTGLLAEIYAVKGYAAASDIRVLRSELSALAQTIDWSSQGSFKGFGGRGGAKEASKFLIRNWQQNTAPVEGA